MAKRRCYFARRYGGGTRDGGRVGMGNRSDSLHHATEQTCRRFQVDRANLALLRNRIHGVISAVAELFQPVEGERVGAHGIVDQWVGEIESIRPDRESHHGGFSFWLG